MTAQQNKEKLAELSQMKRKMVKIVYGSGYEFIQNSGRILTMTHFTQYATYDGMMEGLPTRKSNDSLISHHADKKAYVLHAPRLYGDFNKLLPDPLITRNLEDDPYEVLPGIICQAKMTSTPCESTDWDDIDPPSSSGLTLVWFQNTWCMPLDPEVMEKLKAFDWDAHAVNLGLW